MQKYIHSHKLTRRKYFKVYIVFTSGNQYVYIVFISEISIYTALSSEISIYIYIYIYIYIVFSSEISITGLRMCFLGSLGSKC